MRDIQDTLASLPEEAVIDVSVEENLTHDRKEDLVRKLEYLRHEEELIEQEREDREAEEEKAEEIEVRRCRLNTSA